MDDVAIAVKSDNFFIVIPRSELKDIRVFRTKRKIRKNGKEIDLYTAENRYESMRINNIMDSGLYPIHNFK